MLALEYIGTTHIYSCGMDIHVHMHVDKQTSRLSTYIAVRGCLSKRFSVDRSYCVRLLLFPWRPRLEPVEMSPKKLCAKGCHPITEDLGGGSIEGTRAMPTVAS